MEKSENISTKLAEVELSTPAEFEEAAALYRRVFGYAGTEFTLNPLLLCGMVANGGTAVGLRDGTGALVGFAYGFPGYRDGKLYQYSQAAVIAPGQQGQGVGRRLKYAQRDLALARGMRRMRWAYDPFYARNGHFNLDVLGATGRWFHADFYGRPGTERVVVDWDLTADPPATRSPAPPRPGSVATPEAWGRALPGPDGLWLPLPAGVTVAARPLGADLQRVRARFMVALAAALTGGARLLNCVRVSPETAMYRIA